MAKDETVLEMLGEYIRELSVLVLVFFPLELSKGEFSKPLMIKVAEFSFSSLFVGILLSKSTVIKVFVKRFFGALWKEFFPKEAK